MELQNIRILARGRFGIVNSGFRKGFALLACMLLTLVPQGFSQVYNPENSFGNRPPIDLSSISKESFEPGMFRVKFSAGMDKSLQGPAFSMKNGRLETGIPEFDELCEAFGVREGVSLLESFYQLSPDKSISPETIQRHRDWGFNRWYEFTVEEGQDIPALLKALSGLYSIEVAEPVFRIEMADISDEEDAYGLHGWEKTNALGDVNNDPRLADQWSFYNFGQNGGTPGVDIGLIQAWSYEKGNPAVIVAIVDGGIHTDHPDLQANMWQDGQGRFGYNFANETHEIFPGNHATHVAGTVAAVTNNGIGVSGIAGGSGNGDGVRIMNCQVFGDNRTGGFHLAPVFAADNGAAISQNSWSYASPGVYDQIALDAIDYFNTYGGGDVLDGGITIFAAGNRGKDEEIYPARYSGTIAVASTNSMDVKALNSTYGDWVDISAPGVHIVSTIGTNGYGSSSGTSMASPHVAGVAALMVSMAPGQLTADEVIWIIKATADDHYSMNPEFTGKLGTGRLNAAAAIQALAERLGIAQPEEPGDYYFLADGDWNDLNNWSLDKHQKVSPPALPESSSRVHIIARATSETPIVLEGEGHILIYSEGELSIPELDLAGHTSENPPITVFPLGRLTTGNILAGATIAPIRIHSDERGSGSLIHGSGSVQAEVEYYFGGPSGSSHMLAAPVSGQAISEDFTGGAIFGWHEPGQAWVSPDDPTDLPAWQEANNGSSAFLPGKGYLAASSFDKDSEPIKTFSGNLQSGEVILSLSNKASSGNQGLNLAGNPYPSAIDWNATSGWTGRNNLKTSGGPASGYSYWVWNPELGNYGAYNSMSASQTGTIGASRFIRPMQAFWVRAEADGETLTVGNEARVHHTQPSDDGPVRILRLAVEGDANHYGDEMVIEFGHLSSQGGSEKLFSVYPEAPALFTEKNDTPYSISFLDEWTNHTRIPVSFHPGADATYTIHAEGMLWFDEEVFLVDLESGESHNLTRDPSYTFTALGGDAPGRFLLQFGEEMTTNTHFAEELQPKVYHANGQLHIVNPWHESTQMQVFSATGAAVTGSDPIPQGSYQTSLQVRPGIYIIRVTREGQIFSEKVIVGNV